MNAHGDADFDGLTFVLGLIDTAFNGPRNGTGTHKDWSCLNSVLLRLKHLVYTLNTVQQIRLISGALLVLGGRPKK